MFRGNQFSLRASATRQELEDLDFVTLYWRGKVVAKEAMQNSTRADTEDVLSADVHGHAAAGKMPALPANADVLSANLRAPVPAGKKPALPGSSQVFLARPALRTAPSIQGSASYAANVHGARKPTGDNGAQTKYADQHRQVQQQVPQA